MNRNETDPLFTINLMLHFFRVFYSKEQYTAFFVLGTLKGGKNGFKINNNKKISSSCKYLPGAATMKLYHAVKHSKLTILIFKAELNMCFITLNKIRNQVLSKPLNFMTFSKRTC